jgi:hypothetical protein
LTDFTLTKKSGVVLTFMPSGKTVAVSTKWANGDSVTAKVSVGLARKMWASEVKAGAKVATVPSPGPTFVAGGHLVFDCLDPEFHDGEECTCAAAVAAARAEHAEEFRTPPPGTFAYRAWVMAKSGAMTGDEADAWKDRMKDEALGLGVTEY